MAARMNKEHLVSSDTDFLKISGQTSKAVDVVLRLHH